MNPWLYALPLLAYLYGAVPFGFTAARLIKGVDIREIGSGSIGATNAARALGFKFFPIIFLLDISKGLLPTMAARLWVPAGAFDPHPLVVGTGLAAILGHVFPIYLGFKGGKGVATGTGVFLVLSPWAVLIAACVWAGVFAVWRYVSLASISAAVALPAAASFLHHRPLGEGVFAVAFAAFAGIFIIWLHHSNIRRLLAGTERKIGGGRPNRQEPREPDPPTP